MQRHGVVRIREIQLLHISRTAARPGSLGSLLGATIAAMFARAGIRILGLTVWAVSFFALGRSFGFVAADRGLLTPVGYPSESIGVTVSSDARRSTSSRSASAVWSRG